MILRKKQIREDLSALEAKFIQAYKGFSKRKNFNELLACFQKYIALQREHSQLFSIPNLFKNLLITDNGKQKPLLHFVVEHMNDLELLEILDICLRFEFNPNIQNAINETSLHVNFYKSQFCCQVT